MANSLIFITGATGFVGSTTALVALEAGHRVRLSCRRPEQQQFLRSLYPTFSDKIETVVIPNLSDPVPFKNALKDVDYIFHIASPTPGAGDDVRADYVEPAIRGTITILQAALEFPQIKKIMVMSSVLAIVSFSWRDRKHISIKDNTGEIIPVDLDRPFPEGRPGHGMRYSVSKVLAHQATCDFIKGAKPHYVVMSFHPVFVLGHSLVQQTPDGMDDANSFFWTSMSQETTTLPNSWIHVRDIGDAHIKGIEREVKSGTEFLLAAPSVRWEDVVEFINDTYPELQCKLKPPFEGWWDVDTTTADTVLGMKWRSKEAMIKDVVDQQVAIRQK